jgi:hypothetical protein
LSHFKVSKFIFAKNSSSNQDFQFAYLSYANKFGTCNFWLCRKLPNWKEEKLLEKVLLNCPNLKCLVISFLVVVIAIKKPTELFLLFFFWRLFIGVVCNTTCIIKNFTNKFSKKCFNNKIEIAERMSEKTFPYFALKKHFTTTLGSTFEL